MAKKRGRKKKSTVQKHELPGGFWRQVSAVLIVCLAVLFVVSWFHSGGPALVALNNAMQGVIGQAYYLLPFVMIFNAVKIFKAENFRIDPACVAASIVMLILAAGLCGAPNYGAVKSTGGFIGDGLNSFVMENLDLPIAIFIYAVLILITALFMYAKTPAEILSDLRSFFASSEREEKVQPKQKRRKAAALASVDEAEDLPKLVNIHGAVKPDEELKKKPRAGFLAKKSEATSVKEDSKAENAKQSGPVVASGDEDWVPPSLSLLNPNTKAADPGNVNANAMAIQRTFAEFGIDVEVEDANVGPRVTQYTFRPPQGVKVSKIAQYDKDLAANLATDKVRIEAPIPGTRSVGVEIQNKSAASVGLHELLTSNAWKNASKDKPLAFTLGKDISGQVVVGNLAKMPHLLIAGTTGSGKSVMTNTLIMSMLYHNSPADLRFIIVDPKQVEMAAYEDIPHLLTPIITQTDKALSALRWSVNEMERRYTLMAEKRVKNIVDYNNYIAKTAKPNKEDDNEEAQEGKMPYIVVVVDEMADIMMTAGKELEASIVRIAQKGRAAGIHLVLATQRPQVKVVTGLIKANVPGRIAFAVNNSTDSRIMLDMSGAEKLLGRGDMLYLTTEMMGKPRRVQGAFISDPEIEKVTKYLREQQDVQYNDEVISQAVNVGGVGGEFGAAGGGGSADAELNWNAAKVAVEAGKLSTSLLGRRLNIGYGKAARAMDNLEQMGVISPAAGGNKPREVLIGSMDEYPGQRFD